MSISPEKLTTLWGFSQNPFEYYKAEDEEDAKNLIDPWSFFVEPRYFQEIIGNTERSKPKSSIVFAHRGEGKSFLCKRVLQSLRLDRSNFIVEYINFSDFKTEDLDKITIEYHLDKIISLCLNKVVDEILINRNLFDKLDPNEKKKLMWFINNYYSGLIENKGDILEKIFYPGQQKIWSPQRLCRRFVGYLKRINIEINIFNTAKLSIPSTPESRNLIDVPRRELMEQLRDLINFIGFKSIYIIIDKLDESGIGHEDINSMTKFIVPLLINSSYLEIPDICLKIFIPKQIKDTIEMYYPKERQIRTDRGEVFVIPWDKDNLNKMIIKRLKAYSSDKIETFDGFLDPKDPEIKEYFENNLLYYSADSPRNLNRIMHYIIAEIAWQCDDESGPTYITRDAIDIGIKRLKEENQADDMYSYHLKTNLPNFREDLLIHDLPNLDSKREISLLSKDCANILERDLKEQAISAKE